MASEKSQGGVICTFCGRPVRSGNVNENGMGSTCARKHAQQQASLQQQAGQNASEKEPYFSREGRPFFGGKKSILKSRLTTKEEDWSEYNTNGIRIQKVFHNIMLKKKEVYFYEGDTPCRLTIDSAVTNSRHSARHLTYTLEAEGITPIHCKADSPEGKLLQESYPFIKNKSAEFYKELHRNVPPFSDYTIYEEWRYDEDNDSFWIEGSDGKLLTYYPEDNSFTAGDDEITHEEAKKRFTDYLHEHYPANLNEEGFYKGKEPIVAQREKHTLEKVYEFRGQPKSEADIVHHLVNAPDARLREEGNRVYIESGDTLTPVTKTAGMYFAYHQGLKENCIRNTLALHEEANQ